MRTSLLLSLLLASLAAPSANASYPSANALCDLDQRVVVCGYLWSD